MRQNGGPSHSLPVELTSFVGRRHEVEEAKALLSTGRLVTIIGPGGVGKTRLALSVARHVNRAFPDGIVFVDLAPLKDDDLVIYTFADTLGINAAASHEETLEVITRFLGTRQTLLVLDNCEHVLAPCAQIVGRILRANGEVRVLATSRQALGVDGEHIYTLRTLAVPGPEPPEPLRAEAAAQYPGLALFAERAAAIAGFELNDENCGLVAELCRRLDGLPLAIELAAVRTRMLSPKQILERMAARANLLVTVSREAPARHRTLEAALDWSHELCSPAEQVLWARASVFAGWFDVDAAEGVCSGGSLAPGAVLEAITGLVDKSILAREERAGRMHYRLLETLAHYGRERLQEAGESGSVARRHRDWFLALAHEMEASWFGSNQLQWSRRMRSVHDDLRSALQFCLDTPGERHRGLEMAAALHFYWFSCGHLSEGRLWLTRYLAADGRPTVTRARALRVMALLTASSAETEQANAVVRECQELAVQCDAPFLVGASNAALALSALYSGQLRKGLELAKKALLCPQYAAHPEHCQALSLLGQAHALLGEYEQAASVAARLFDEADALKAEWVRTRALMVLCMTRLTGEHANDGQQKASELLRRVLDLNDAPGIGTALGCIAVSTIYVGDYERGAVLLGLCQRLWPLLGVPDMTSVYDRGQFVARARAALGESVYQRAWDRGRHLDFESGMAYALGNDGRPNKSRAALRSPLTKREQQVAELITLGLSNKEIAARLVISPRTADGHVVHILSKLGFTSRAQIAAWSTQQHRAAPTQ